MSFYDVVFGFAPLPPPVPEAAPPADGVVAWLVVIAMLLLPVVYFAWELFELGGRRKPVEGCRSFRQLKWQEQTFLIFLFVGFGLSAQKQERFQPPSAPAPVVAVAPGLRDGGGEEEEGDDGRAFTPAGAEVLPPGWTNRPPEAIVYADWQKFGHSRAAAYFPTNGVWAFPVRGVPVDGLWVALNGSIALDRAGWRAASNTVSVARGPMSLDPSQGGVFWYCLTETNAVFTLERVSLGRDPALPATLQFVFCRDGGVALRYALLNPSADYAAALAPYVVGTRVDGADAQEWALGGAAAPRGGGGGTRDGGGWPPDLLDFLTANPTGAELRFKGRGVPEISVSPAKRCFHSVSPHVFTLRGTNGFNGTVSWRYGDGEAEGNPAAFAPDLRLMPGEVTARFTVGGITYTTNCPVSYCGRIIPPVPPENEEEAHGRHWCPLCEVEYTCPPGHFHGPGTNAPPQGGVVRRGTVPVRLPGTPRFPDDYVTFYPAGRYPTGGTNGCDCGGPHHYPGGMFPCCLCPEHNPSGDSNGGASTNHLRLTAADSGLAAYTGTAASNLTALSVGHAILPGTAVHVIGVVPSALPGDRALTFAYDTPTRGGGAEVNAFTAFGIHLAADYDNSGVIDDGDILTSHGQPVKALEMFVTQRARCVKVFPFTDLPGEKVLSLSGEPGALRVWDGPPTASQIILNPGEALTNPAPMTAWIEAFGPCRADLTLSFTGTGEAEGYSRSYSLPVIIRDVLLQPITTETAPVVNGAIVNPAAVASNGLARYSINVQPSLPAGEIVWDITEGAGNVIFYNGNTGPDVTVRGKAEGGFKLEATIGDPPLMPKPYIYGRVLTNTTTTLDFYVICDASGHAAVTTSQIDQWVADANHYGRQVAMRFTKGNVIPITNSVWFNIPNHTVLTNMFAYTNNVKGLKIYCVNSLPDEDMGLSYRRVPYEINPEDGIALAANALPHIPPHEILHACGLDDITDIGPGLGNRLVDKDLVRPINWSGGTGTGYYPSDLEHRMLIRSLLMYGAADVRGTDIPLGAVKGFGVPGQPEWRVLKERFVGLDMLVFGRDLEH